MRAFAVACVAASIALGVSYAVARGRVLNPRARVISAAEAELARLAWRNSTPDERFGDAPELSPLRLPEGIPAPSDADLSANIHARAAILVDATTGAVLFEKDADEKIPPASMTKLVALYVAFRAAAAGEIGFDDVVTLPPDSWAVNIPPGSSLMFLGEGQRVTVRELFAGMAVASGNDAAIAIAYHVAGGVAPFVERMNGEMERLGLSGTTFDEPSGLSERNFTSTREFADFCLVYTKEYPEALKAFHSLEKIEYPNPWNLPAGSAQKPYVQRATNHLLGVLPGCDGLKTGFIYESGYNLALTAMRNGTRFISVTMGGPGNGSAEGSRLRSEDGARLMEWAFANFQTVRPEQPRSYPIAVFGGTERAIMAIAADAVAFTAPRDGLGETPPSGGQPAGMETSVTSERFLRAPIAAGDVVGTIRYSVNGKIYREVQLVADRGVARSNALDRAKDALLIPFAELAAKKARN